LLLFQQKGERKVEAGAVARIGNFLPDLFKGEKKNPLSSFSSLKAADLSLIFSNFKKKSANLSPKHTGF
jgi:hypothetical protein